MKEDIREKKLPANLQEAFFGEYISEWYMTDAERSCLIMLQRELRPAVSIEIGTFNGGSLSVLSRFSKQVYTLDIDPTSRERFGERFPNVEFITGRSQETLPPLLSRLMNAHVPIEFVLIDGDHSRSGVRDDIDHLLTYRPVNPLFVVMHDSFNPDCRQGMHEARWSHSPYVHSVELDFVPGRLSRFEDGTLQMWCGFALALMLPIERSKPLEIHANEELLFHTISDHIRDRHSDAAEARLSRRMAGLGRKIRELF